MDFDLARATCLDQAGAFEDFPFGPENHVFKVGGKMFALIAADGEHGPRIVLKCEPGLVELNRERYASVVAPPYFNRGHWNMVKLDGGVPSDEIEEWIEDSYALVVNKLPKRSRPGAGAG